MYLYRNKLIMTLFFMQNLIHNENLGLISLFAILVTYKDTFKELNYR